ncbi:MAG: tetratricopeptide repeat protein [Planctomycetota bacterium]
MNRTRLLRRHGLLIFLVALLAYATAVAGTFLYDDIHSVRDNQALESLAAIPRLLVDPSAFTSYDAKMWRPVLLVTFALNHAMGGGSPLPFKVTDILLHALTALSLWSVARAMGTRIRVATAVALLFAVHPLASEAVGFVSSRSDQLLALGALLAVRCHIGHRNGSRIAPIGTIAALILACGSKETGVVLPGLLFLADLALDSRDVPLVRCAFASLRRLAPTVVVAILWLAARHELLGHAAAPMPEISAPHPLGAPRHDLIGQWCAMGGVLARFLGQTLLPIDLTPDPPVATGSGPWAPSVLWSWFLVLGFTAIGLLQFRRRPGVFVGTCLAWAIALPWVVVPLNSPAGEHRFYGALAGVLLAVAAAVRSTLLRRPVVRWVGAVVLGVFAVQSARLSLDYRDGAALWSRALAVDPGSHAALCGLAQVEQDAAAEALQRGDHDGWAVHLRQALDLGVRAIARRREYLPTRRQVVRYRLMLGPELGEPQRAVVEASALVELRPRNPNHRILLAESLIQAGIESGNQECSIEAERVAMSCLDFAEAKGLVWRVAAEACTARGDHAAALRRLDDAIALGMDGVPLRLDRVEVLRRLGRGAEARVELRRVLAMSPFDARARQLDAELASPPR